MHIIKTMNGRKTSKRIPFETRDSLVETYGNYRFWVSSRILQNSVKRDNGCIEYAGGNLKHRYGLISITLGEKRMRVPAHRAMWMAKNDRFDLPRNTFVRHKCDNPCCVNIDHLQIGSPKDNSQDCTDRGRRAKNYKLHTRHRIHDDAKIIAIRNASGKTSHIAEQFGVSIGYVSKIKTGKAKSLVA